MIVYKEFDSDRIDEVKRIFKKEGWNAYLKDDEKLKRAFDQSFYVLGAFDDGNVDGDDELIGLIRCVGDGEHIVLVQDLIVDPDYQKQGIGTCLFKSIMKRYAHVRMFMVITDKDDPVDNKFYQSFQLKKLEQLDMVGYIRE